MKQRTSYQKLIAVSALVLAGALTGCGQGAMNFGQKVFNHGASEGIQLSSSTNSVITVTDSKGRALADAKVLIGMGLNNPFDGNFLTTDSQGTVEIPAQWTGPMPVTVEARGHVRTTFYDRLPSQSEFQIRRAPGDANYQITGDTTNYAGLSDGRHVNAGLVFPTYTRGELSGIDLHALLSQETDRLTVFGKTFDLPSNLSIPTQSVTYILPVTLSKPRFRIFFDEPTARRLAVVHVRGVLQDLVDDFQNGFSITKAANKLKFIGGSVKEHSGGPKPGFLSMAVNESAFTPSIEVTAPRYDSSQQMISLAIPEWGGVYSISDIKAMPSGGKVTLVAPQENLAKGLVVSLLRANREKESANGVENSFFSAAVTPANRSQEIAFIDVVQAPEYQADTLVLHPPQVVTGVEKLMTRAVLSHIEIPEKGKYKLERKTPQWELYASDWTSRLTLPQWPEGENTPTTGKMRWETEFAGVPTLEAAELKGALDVNILEKVTHVTRSGLDL